MAHTFDIRFVRSAGLAGLFEAPANVFGWRGSGSLSIDPQGMRIEVKRGLLSLLARRRSHRIPAGNIREVFRAGEALRIEFANDTDTRAVIPFWVLDRDTAAQIVELLPTSRTIELEEQAPAARGAATSNRLAALIILFAVIACGVLFFTLRGPQATATATVQPPRVISPEQVAVRPPTGELLPETGVPPGPAPVESPQPAAPQTTAEMPGPVAETAAPAVSEIPETTATPAAAPRRPRAEAPKPAANTQDEENFVPEIPEIRVSPADVVVPIRQGTLAYDKARSLFKRFDEGATELSEDYRHQRELSDAGRISLDEYAQKLQSLAGRWRELSSRLLDTRDANDPALTGLRATLLAVASYEISFLNGYAGAVQSLTVSDADKPFEDLRHAEQLLESARRFIQ